MPDDVTPQAGDTTPATTPGGTTPPPTQQAGDPPASFQSPAPDTDADQLVEKLPKWVQTLIGDLRKENATHRTAKKQVEDAAAAAARQAAEEQGQFKQLYETEKAAREQAEATAKAERLAALRLKVGTKHKLPAPLVERLQGDTEEALEADATALAAALPKAPPQAGGTDGPAGTNPKQPAPTKTDAEIRELAAIYGVSFEALKAQLNKE